MPAVAKILSTIVVTKALRSTDRRRNNGRGCWRDGVDFRRPWPLDGARRRRRRQRRRRRRAKDFPFAIITATITTMIIVSSPKFPMTTGGEGRYRQTVTYHACYALQTTCVARILRRRRRDVENSILLSTASEDVPSPKNTHQKTRTRRKKLRNSYRESSNTQEKKMYFLEFFIVSLRGFRVLFSSSQSQFSYTSRDVWKSFTSVSEHYIPLAASNLS